MKKLVALCAGLLASVATFAQTSYSDLYQQAQKYESEKKWISALGTYYDAMEASPNYVAMDAYNAWNKLIGNIKAGNPGNDSYDDFSRVEGWESLAKDAEAYFSTHAPFKIATVYEKGELDMKNRTATYYVAAYAQDSEKYEFIISAIREGSKKTSNSPVPKDWPQTSIYKDAKTRDAAVTAITIPKSTANTDVLSYETNGSKVTEYGTNKSAFGKTYYVPSWIMRDFKTSATSGQMSLYDIQLELVDENGKVLGTSDKANLYGISGLRISSSHDIKDEPTVLTFSNINADGIAAIDSGKFSIRVKSLVLKNDNLSAKFVKNGEDGKITRQLARNMGYSWWEIDQMFGDRNEIVFKASTVSVFTVSHVKDFDATASAVVLKPKTVKEITFMGEAAFGNTYARQKEFFFEYGLFSEIQESNQQAKNLIKNVKHITDADYDVYINGDTTLLYSINALSYGSYPQGFGDNLEGRAYSLNIASIQQGLQPAYSINGEVNPEKWETDSYNGGGKSYKGEIKENVTADGYREINDDEYQLLRKDDSVSKRIKTSTIVRSIVGSNKDQVIAEFKAKQAAAEAAKHGKIASALEEYVKPIREKFLVDVKDYKTMFKPVKGSFDMEIPLVGKVKRNINILVAPIEVTQQLWEQIMGSNPSTVKDPFYPVTNISYYEAIVFCNKLSVAAGLEPAYTMKKSTDVSTWGEIPTKPDKDWNKISVSSNATGFRLPTSEEALAYTNGKLSVNFGYGDTNKLYYVATKESGTINIDGEKIGKPTEADPDAKSFELYNVFNNAYEMYRDKKDSGYRESTKTVNIGSAEKNEKIGLRVICGK